MSYAEKHPHVAACYVPNCPDPGTRLQTQAGVLAWWCERHAQKEVVK